jgi:hypothetical protein
MGLLTRPLTPVAPASHTSAYPACGRTNAPPARAARDRRRPQRAFEKPGEVGGGRLFSQLYYLPRTGGTSGTTRDDMSLVLIKS